MQQCIKILLFLVLNEAQHVSGDTAPIIRSLKLHKQPLVLHTWKVVGRIAVGRCWTLSGSVATWQRPTAARPTTFHVCKTRGCLCSFRLLMMGVVSPETCWASFKIRNNNMLIHCCILLGFSLWELYVINFNGLNVNTTVHLIDSYVVLLQLLMWQLVIFVLNKVTFNVRCNIKSR